MNSPLDTPLQERSERLKIAYVADIVNDNGVGAVQSSVRFIKGLRRHHDVTVIATGPEEENRHRVPSLFIPGVQWIIDKNGFDLAGPGRKVLKEVLPGHDVVYIQYSLFLGFFALREARRLGIPVVFGFHFQPQNILYNLNCNVGWLNRLLLRFFNRFFYNLADHVICPSPAALEELKSGGFEGSSSVITNGLPPQFRPCDVDEAGDKQQFVVLMVGRLSREKRHDLVIEALLKSRHRDRIKLVVTGHGPMLENIEQMASQLPVPAETGFVSQERLIELYNTADLLVHASETELEGMAVLEAIGCGLPALIANCETSASSQFAIDERFLFEAGDLEQLVQKIDHLIDHPKQLQEARAAFLDMASGFSYEQALVQMEQVMAGTAAIHPRAGTASALLTGQATGD